MLKIKCDICGREIEKKGAILFSPPDKRELCKKTHICTECYREVMKYLGVGSSVGRAGD